VVVAQVPGTKVSDGFVFSWLDGGLRKMAKTNTKGHMLDSGNVPDSSSTWYDSGTWSVVIRNNWFGYYVTNFRCPAVAPTLCSAGSTADFSQYNLGVVAARVPGTKVSDGFVFYWLDGGLRKMAKTNTGGQMLACGSVPDSSSTWQDTRTWNDFIRTWTPGHQDFGYYVTNFQCS
jgi:hypothetical protein